MFAYLSFLLYTVDVLLVHGHLCAAYCSNWWWAARSVLVRHMTVNSKRETTHLGNDRFEALPDSFIDIEGSALSPLSLPIPIATVTKGLSAAASYDHKVVVGIYRLLRTPHSRPGTLVITWLRFGRVG